MAAIPKPPLISINSKGVSLQLFQRINKLISPQLNGLEQVLENVRDRSVPVSEAADEIRHIASRPNFPPWTAAVFKIAGLIALLVGGGMTIYQGTFSLGAEQATGRVVRQGADNKRLLEVEYFVAGERYAIPSPDSSIPLLQLGDSVVILFKVSDPRVAQINIFSIRWLPVLVPLASGFWLLVLSFAFSYWARRK